MKAIILCAGQGRRLLPLTENRPKSALAVGDRAVLEWQLQEIAQCAIDEVVVVTGFRADVIEDMVAQQRAVPTRTLYNPFYAHCDNLGTCWVARAEMTGEFLIINGDTLFEAAILQRLLAQPPTTPITLVTDSKPSYDDDDMKVSVEHGRLRRVGKQLDLARVNGESIGMMVFRDTGPQHFVRQIDHMMRHGSALKQWYLSAIDQLADADLVSTCPIDGLSWCEIDHRADLERAQIVTAGWYPQTDIAATARG